MTETPLPHGRVLIVDDEVLMGSVLRRMLAGHEVVAVQHPRQALERLQADADFDIVFIDVMLPAMTGPELVAELARLQPELTSRVVFLTGGAFSPEARTAVQRSGITIVEKPFARATIVGLVEERVRARRG